MRTIASVAISALKDMKSNIRTQEWGMGQGYDLYKAWVELRRHNKHNIVQFNEWRDTIVRLIDTLTEGYSDPVTYKNLQKRHYWVSTSNLRVSIHIMGGYRDVPQWETDCKVFIEA